MTNHHAGVMYPSHPWDVDVQENYAPAHVLSRIAHGTFGSFDVGKLVVGRSSATPAQIGESELMELIHDYFPPEKYVGFDLGFVNPELWHEFARDLKKMK